MTTSINNIETDHDGSQWFEISGTDTNGTGWEFQGVEVYAITQDGEVLDCDGCGIVEGDRCEVAIKNALGLN